MLAFCADLAALPLGDPERGREVFQECETCHSVGPEAEISVGPPLNTIISARAAAFPAFEYSEAMTEAAEDGLHWTAETLDDFLADPAGALPGTAMSFGGIRQAQDRADLIAYLATFSGTPESGDLDTLAEANRTFSVAPEILSIKGDLEFGEYLSGECVTCHRAGNDRDSIPTITGWPTDAFVTALHAYREKHRDNEVMQVIANRLADDEIAALAVFFESLGN